MLSLGSNRVVRLRIWGALLLGLTSAQAVAQAETLRLDIDVYSERGPDFPAFSAIRGQVNGTLPIYYFDATLQVFADGMLQEGDLYFGAITPGGDTFSWAADAEGAGWRRGMVPVAAGMDLTKPLYFQMDQVVGRAEHSFTLDDSLGMYSIFALLVNSGADPGDTRYWIEVEMQPFLVRNPPPPPVAQAATSAP